MLATTTFVLAWAEIQKVFLKLRAGDHNESLIYRLHWYFYKDTNSDLTKKLNLLILLGSDPKQSWIVNKG